MKAGIRVLTFFLLLLSLGARAELAPLEDDSLAGVTGQAIFKIQDLQNYPQNYGGALNFWRLTIGADVEINANIGEVVLGNYYRPAGQDCHDGGKFCYSNTGWHCRTNPCGYDSDGSTGGNDTMQDIRITNLSLGTISGSTVTDFIFQDPYIEFAFEGTGASRKLVGLRQGFLRSNGTMGNRIDVLSGAIAPNINANILGIVTNVGRIPFIGTRNKGYIDPVMEPGLTGVLGKGGPQLMGVGTVTLSDSRDFFLSVQNKRVDYPALAPNVGASTTAQPGFWLNMMHGLYAETPAFGIGPLPNNTM